MADTTPKQQRRLRPNKLNPSPSSVLSFPSTPLSPSDTPRRRSSRLRLRYPDLHPPHDSSSPSNDDDDNKRQNKRQRRRSHSSPNTTRPKRRIFYNKVVYDEGEFQVGDDVYVKRRDGASSDEGEDPEFEDCRICFSFSTGGSAVMVECDDCLGGFHLNCLNPPLKSVPDGDWICHFCSAAKMGRHVNLPSPPDGKKRSRTTREKLLCSDLWAARIESIWREADGKFWFKGRWYIIPEETSAGRQPHNLGRELYRTNDYADIEMESVLRHCSVLRPKEYSMASNDGDDIFFCEYEYDVCWHSFKRIAVADNDNGNCEEVENDDDWHCSSESEYDSEADYGYEDKKPIHLSRRSTDYKFHHEKLAANSRRGQIFGLQRMGTKKIPEHVRSQRQTELERAKASLLIATLPKSPPCRKKEMDEIMSFVRSAVCEDECLGRCLYIHGVPGTGKTMSVLTVMRKLHSEVNTGNLKPYCFVEINGLKLASPEGIYKVLYEALSGYRVGWKKALHLLNERFSENTLKDSNITNQTCILLVDELDLLLTRNQSVLYNIFDWPSKPNSKLVVIGISNTMDLPEKFFPRISSRMGIQRLCFGPYNYQQLQEIISSRLEGINAFEKQAIEFASRKVAAISGDARRALEICRRAAELADYRLKRSSGQSIDTPADGNSERYLVGMKEIEASIQEMFQAPHIQVIKNSSRLSKIVLVAMVHELYKSGMAEITFEKLASAVLCLCKSNRERCPGWDTLLTIGHRLGEVRILLCEEGAKHRMQKLQFNFPSDDVAFALKDSPDIPWLAKYL